MKAVVYPSTFDFFRGICSTSKDENGVLKLIDNLIPSLSKSYVELFSEVEKTKQREFFGLRDFYRFVSITYIIL